MLHNQMEMLDCYMMYEKKNTLDSFKICWTSKPPTVFATILELPPFFFNSNKAKTGWQDLSPPELLAVAGTTCEAPGQCEPASGPTGHRDRSHRLLLFIFLKALFLGLRKTQPQKSIRAIKKKAQTRIFRRLRETKATRAHISAFVQLVFFSLNARPLHSVSQPHRALVVCRGWPAPEQLTFLRKRKKLQDELSGFHGDCGIVGNHQTISTSFNQACFVS